MDVVVGTDHAGDLLVEEHRELRRLHARLGDVVGVVEPDGQELARPDGREQADLVQRMLLGPVVAVDDVAVLYDSVARPGAGIKATEPHQRHLRDLDRGLLGRVAAGHRLGVDLLEAHAVRVVGGDLLGVDEHADRVGLELVRGAHPLLRLLPVAEAVDLQLDVVAVGIGVVVGERHPVVQAQRRA